MRGRWNCFLSDRLPWLQWLPTDEQCKNLDRNVKNGFNSPNLSLIMGGLCLALNQVKLIQEKLQAMYLFSFIGFIPLV